MDFAVETILTPDVYRQCERPTAARVRWVGVPLMVAANQQWDRPTAHRMGRVLERFNLVWLEDPLDAHDVAGQAALAAALDTPVATGEMLTSVVDITAEWPAEGFVTTVTLGRTPRRLNVFAAPEPALPSCSVPPVRLVSPPPACIR